MSEEQLKAFLAKVKGDFNLLEKLKGAKSPKDVVGIATARSISGQGHGRLVLADNAGFHNRWEQHEHQAGEDFIESVIIQGLPRGLAGDREPGEQC